MPEKPIMHGRDHRPGGEDPIPGLGGIALAVAYLWNINGTLTVTSGSSTNTRVPWAHFQATDTTVFGTDTSSAANPGPYHNAAGDTYIYLNPLGLYVASGVCKWTSGAYDQTMIIDNPGSQWVLDAGAGESTTQEIPTNSGFASLGIGNYSHRFFYVDSTSTPGIVSMNVAQTSGSSKVLATASMGIFYLGTAPDLTQIY